MNVYRIGRDMFSDDILKDYRQAHLKIYFGHELFNRSKKHCKRDPDWIMGTEN